MAEEFDINPFAEEDEKAEAETAKQNRATTTIQKTPPAKEVTEFEALAKDEDYMKMKAQVELWKRSQFVAPNLKPVDALIVVAYGKELGLAPFEALTNIYIVEKKPSLSAKLMRALVNKNYPDAFIQVVEMTSKRGAVKIGRSKETAFEYEFTEEDAKQAGLFGKSNYKKYPKNMLMNRAMTNGLRTEFPECFLSVPYSVDESAGWVDAETTKPQRRLAAEVNDFATAENS